MTKAVYEALRAAGYEYPYFAAGDAAAVASQVSAAGQMIRGYWP